ncbi:Ribosome maturation factor RimP [Pelotomaculum propionicicum]|uniref:Ribosome maturation factor RimP n=2 Tax=Pelotomaculum propionicicum TaxID=258475 RepID=A0A4Y7RMZ6_9FIRM|nr:ribosome maturation factor RimP [Pelotomaculum propionicicum]TEB10176.1 Ribosome maturation factor RimP [Pelotomaculum propionicicum]
MTKMRVVEIVEKLVSPCISESGMELVDVEFVKEGGNWYLRVFLDKPGGIGIEDCRLISEKIDKLLDEKDPIPQSYFLEVSSPGMERPLKKLSDFERFKGSLAVIGTYAAVEGKKNITGRITSVQGDSITFDVAGTEMTIPYKQVASARLKAEF